MGQQQLAHVLHEQENGWCKGQEVALNNIFVKPIKCINVNTAEIYLRSESDDNNGDTPAPYTSEFSSTSPFGVEKIAAEVVMVKTNMKMRDILRKVGSIMINCYYYFL